MANTSQTLNAAGFGGVNALQVPVLATNAIPQVLAIGTAAAQSEFIGGTVAVVSCTVDCHFAWGANPTADANSMVLPKGMWTIAFQANTKLSVIKITGGTDGLFSVVPWMGS